MRDGPSPWLERAVPIVLIGLGIAAFVALLIAVYVLVVGI